MNVIDLGPLLMRYERRLGYRWWYGSLVGGFAGLVGGLFASALVVALVTTTRWTFREWFMLLVGVPMMGTIAWVGGRTLYRSLFRESLALSVCERGVDVRTPDGHRKIPYESFNRVYAEAVTVVDRYGDFKRSYHRYGFRDEAGFCVNVMTDDAAGILAGQHLVARARPAMGDEVARRMLSGRDLSFGNVKLSATHLSFLKSDGGEVAERVALGDIVAMTHARADGAFYFQVRGRPNAVYLDHDSVTEPLLFANLFRRAWAAVAQGRAFTREDLSAPEPAVPIPAMAPADMTRGQADLGKILFYGFAALFALYFGVNALLAWRHAQRAQTLHAAAVALRAQVARAAADGDVGAPLVEACRGRLRGGEPGAVLLTVEHAEGEVTDGAAWTEHLALVPGQFAPSIEEFAQFAPVGIVNEWTRSLVRDPPTPLDADLSSVRWVGAVTVQSVNTATFGALSEEVTTMRVLDRRGGGVACAGEVRLPTARTRCQHGVDSGPCGPTPSTLEAAAWQALRAALDAR